MSLAILDNKLLAAIMYGLFGLILLINLVGTLARRITKTKNIGWTTYLAFIGLGLIGASICGLHAFGEIAHRYVKPNGLFFEANTGRSLINVPINQWTGWIAVSLIPNFFISGICVSIMTLIITIWCFIGINSKHSGTIMIILFLITMLLGGGFIPIFIGIIAGLFGYNIQKRQAKSATK